MVGESELNESVSDPVPESTWSPPFGASLYAQIIHVFSDLGMAHASVVTSYFSDRENINRERRCIWTEYIANLYNELRFKPVPVEILEGGVRPTVFLHTS